MCSLHNPQPPPPCNKTCLSIIKCCINNPSHVAFPMLYIYLSFCLACKQNKHATAVNQAAQENGECGLGYVQYSMSGLFWVASLGWNKSLPEWHDGTFTGSISMLFELNKAGFDVINEGLLVFSLLHSKNNFCICRNYTVHTLLGHFMENFTMADIVWLMDLES